MTNKNTDAQKKKTLGTVITIVVITIALILFAFFMMNMFDVRISDLENNAAYHDLAVKNFEKSKASPDTIKEMFAGLQKANTGAVAWIDIPGTDVSYPVVQGDDNEYYQTHNYFGKENRGGAIFLSTEASPAFTDANTVIFGQAMNDGSMFSELKEYQDKAFFDTHNSIIVYLPDGSTKTYTVFAAYIASDEDTSFTNSFENEEEFNKYVAAMTALSQNSTDTLPSGNSIITLSTCEKGADTAKYVVQAVLQQ
ncbi:MAG: class B sortase [Christensenella sp.]